MKNEISVLRCLIHLCIFQLVFGISRSRVTWVNGIAHNAQHMEEGQEVISQWFGLKRVEYCHNPTAMKDDNDIRGYGADIFQASTQLAGRITHEVNELVAHLQQALYAVGSRGVVVHIAHSQGALITYLALKQFPSEDLKRLECLCFGGAAAIRKSDFPTLRRTVNYYSVNDPLLFVVPSAARALETGMVFTPLSTEPEFVFLTPKVGNPTEDHGLLNPTYGEALRWEGRRYQSQYQSGLERFVLRPIILHVPLIIAAVLANPVWDPIKKWFQMYIFETFIKPIIRIIKLIMQVLAYYIKAWKYSAPGGAIFEPIVVEKL